MRRYWEYIYPVEPTRSCPSDYVKGRSLAVGETYGKRFGKRSLRQVGCRHSDRMEMHRW